MRLLKILFAGLIAVVTVVAGLAIAALVALGGALFFLLRRLLRGSRAPVGASPRQRRRPAAASGGDVIEVTATEVRGDPRLP